MTDSRPPRDEFEDGFDRWDDLSFEEREIRDALVRAMDVPEIDPAFAAELRDRVLSTYDEQFEDVKPAAVTRRPVWRRLASVSTTLVACVLCLVALWPSGPAFSFETMRSAIRQQAVMRVAARSVARGDVVAWYRPGQTSLGGVSLAAVEAAGRVYWADDSGSSRWVYDLRDGDVRPVTSPETASLLLDMLTTLDHGGRTVPGRMIHSERWEWSRADAPRLAVLTITLDQGDVSFGLDPQTSLPKWVEIDGAGRLPVEFRAGTHAPSGLAALGVTGDVIARTEGLAAERNAIVLAEKMPAAPDVVAPPDASMNLAEVMKPLDAFDQDEALARVASVVTVPDAVVKSAPTRIAARRWRSSVAVEAPAEASAMASRVDQRLAKLWVELGVEPVDRADDHDLKRRLSLDLIGRTPYVGEIRGRESQPVEQVIDDLLSSPEFAEHLGDVWTELLLPDNVDLTNYGGTDAFRDWLVEQFAADVGYDQVVRQLLLAEGRVNESGPVLFYTALNMDPERLAKQTSRVFLGTQIDCAQCHDHPYDDWTQRDFWSYAAFFARISRPSGNMEMLSSVLRVKDTGRGDVTFPNTDEVIPPQFLGGALLDEQSGNTRRRHELAEWMTSRDNRQFARATVNHVWAQMFGTGLVSPSDDFGAHNAPLDDVLLDELAESFAAGGYQLRTLVRTLALTRAYQLSSAGPNDDAVRRRWFAQREPKWLSPGQLYDAALSAARGVSNAPTASTMSFGATFSGTMPTREQFIAQFATTTGSLTEYQAGIPQALALMNGAFTDRLSAPESSQLLQALTAPFLSDGQRLETVFLATVNRPPDDAERSVMLPLLEDAGDKAARQQVLSDIFWALLNSAEFATNH